MKKIFTAFIITTSLFFATNASAQITLNSELVQQILPLIVEIKNDIDNQRISSKTISLIFRLQALLEDSGEIPIASFDARELGFDNEDYIAVYSVKNLDLLLSDGDEGSFDSEVWDILKNISDKDILNKYLKYFAVYDDSDSDVVAFVEESSFNQDWLMAINLAELSFDSRGQEYDVVETMIHEYAHVVSFNNDQVLDISEENCRTRYVSEGCPLDTSYYQSFVDSFWSQKDLYFVDNIGELDDEQEIDQELFDFYEDNEDSFISDYAATNPGEDFAESFAHFMLHDIETKSDIKFQKSNFFFRYPELVILRNSVMSTYKHLL